MLAYNQPEFILLSCLIAGELRKNETVWILGGHLVEKGGVNLLFAVFCSHCFFDLDPGFISTYQMWMNVPIPKVAQSIRLAVTVLEATLAPATQDMYPEVERRVSRDQGRRVKVGAGVFWESRPICLERQQCWRKSSKLR